MWNFKSIISLIWIPSTVCHVLGIELHMKRKFNECLTKRHPSTSEYVYGVTQSDVESKDAERGFDKVARNFWCEQYISTRHLIVRK
jgi:hypothetical protein